MIPTRRLRGIFKMGVFKKDSTYRSALSWLSYMYPTLQTHVLNLGKPKLVNYIATAAVEHHGKGVVASSKSHYFDFVINPMFEQSLNEHDYAFVLSHETFHILLGHLAIYKKYDNQAKFNIATDCIINDWLYDFGIEPDKFKPCYGPNIVGFNTSQSSLDEIYRLIPDEMCPQDGQCSGNCDGQADDSGAVGSGTCNCPQTVDDHNAMFGGNSGQGQDPADIKKSIEDFVNGGGFKDLPPTAKDFVFDNNDIVREMMQQDRPQGGWSPTGFGLTVEEQLADGVNLKWAELMQEITPDLYNAGNFNTSMKRSFARSNKKLVTVFPKVILPAPFFESGGVGNSKNKDNNSFVLALDCSGSIGAEDKRKFLALAHSIPRSKAKVFACTFSTNYVEYDIDGNPGQLTASGGTDFGAIEEYVQDVVVKELGRYPKAIVVITDGYAPFGYHSPTDDQLEKNWYWLITQGASTSDNRINKLSDGHMWNLDKFVK
jgi:predicted metal-dependent peptidase